MLDGFFNSKLRSDLALLFVVSIWGSTFALMKGAFDDVGPFYFLTLRFGLAFFILLLLFFNRLKKIDVNILKSGTNLGVVLFLGFALQVSGLRYTTASKAGFITGLSVVLVPFLGAIFFKKKLSLSTCFGVIFATGGLFLLSFDGVASLNYGDLLIFLCALSFALHILFVDKYVKFNDAILLALIQIGVVALLSGVLAVFRGGVVSINSSLLWANILYMGLFATAIALLIQNKAQEKTTPAKAAIIFSLEPVFGSVFSYAILGELISPRAYFGGGLIVLGMVLAQIRFKESLIINKLQTVENK
ncbi:DMT family transporter [Halonatronum saccharophilum]|uniref:DMT family transporter n=1 Tax=Halonatronum saccharophilum TaxID=150060 RepID=UPI0004807905|nr:DMT family transporter [Halonatronum saccharophilum]